MRSKKFTPAFSLLVGVIIKYILNIKLLKILPDVVWYGGVIECCIAALTCYFVAFAISFGFFLEKNKNKIKNF